MGKKTQRTSHLYGLGLDSDGHKRVTTGENFTLSGGSEESHAQMTEATIRAKEDLRRKGRNFANADPEEIKDAIRKYSPKAEFGW